MKIFLRELNENNYQQYFLIVFVRDEGKIKSFAVYKKKEIFSIRSDTTLVFVLCS